MVCIGRRYKCKYEFAMLNAYTHKSIPKTSLLLYYSNKMYAVLQPYRNCVHSSMWLMWTHTYTSAVRSLPNGAYAHRICVKLTSGSYNSHLYEICCRILAMNLLRCMKCEVYNMNEYFELLNHVYRINMLCRYFITNLQNRYVFTLAAWNDIPD